MYSHILRETFQYFHASNFMIFNEKYRNYHNILDHISSHFKSYIFSRPKSTKRNSFDNSKALSQGALV